MTPASLWQTEFTLTEQEYVDANLLFSRPTTGARKVFALAAIILLLIAILVDSELARALSLGALLGGTLGQLLARFVVAPWRTRRQYHAYQAVREPMEVEQTEQGMHFRAAMGQSDIAWQNLHKWRENDEFVLVYQAPEVYHIIPKRALSVVEPLTDALREQVGEPET